MGWLPSHVNKISQVFSLGINFQRYNLPMVFVLMSSDLLMCHWAHSVKVLMMQGYLMIPHEGVLRFSVVLVAVGKDLPAP